MPTLFMVQLGARPKGRLIEQHDIFFGVGDSLGALIPAINNHWPEVKNKWHIDSYQSVTQVIGVDGRYYKISWRADGLSDYTQEEAQQHEPSKLYFINLGGYQQGSIEEFHHKLLVVAPTESAAKAYARKTRFYKDFSYSDKETPFNGASHIDDKLCVDFDEIYDVSGLIDAGRLIIEPLDEDNEPVEDKAYVGYLSIKKLKALDL